MSDKLKSAFHEELLETELAALCEQNRVLVESLTEAYLELAALFPKPKAPTLEDAKKVCESKNEADARCLYGAFVELQAALTPAGQRLTPNEATE